MHIFQIFYGRAGARFSEDHAHAHTMVKREHPEIDLAAGEVDGEPVVQRRRSQVEPDHLLCPITRDMFRDPVILIESGHTYEKAAIQHHLRLRRTDPRTNVRVQSIALSTNMAIRMAVDAWLADNPGVTPDGWDSRELLAPSLRQHRPTLHTCAEKGHLDVARDLIEAGADVNAKDNEGLTPLYMCALGGHVEVARALIEAGADVNAKKDNGVTPLHMCAYTGHLEVSRALIEKGADVNAKEDDGVTPLYVCSQEGHLEGHLEVARALIKAGSNFNGLSSEQVANLCRRLI
jgi:ankyrin repeat protein